MRSRTEDAGTPGTGMAASLSPMDGGGRGDARHVSSRVLEQAVDEGPVFNFLPTYFLRRTSHTGKR